MLRVILFAIAVGAVACVSSGASPDRAKASGATHGRQLYVADGCAQCHGFSGQGTVGPRLAPNPIPLDIFTRQMRNPRGVMPIYTSRVLSESDLADIYTYLKSVPQPMPVAKIPLLK
jgi:ubiquinol-cytochrome c reductase cytochrome c subunit